MQNAGIAALGLNWRYLAFEVRPEELRAAIASVAETHGLPAEERDSGREIAGLLRISWESLAEIDSRRLGAYGRVDPGLRASLDPTLERMMALVVAIEEIAVGRRVEDDPQSV